MKKNVAWGHIRIYAPDTNNAVTFLLDTNPPKPAGEYGGWSSIAVPRHRAIRYWSGTPDPSVAVDVIVLPGVFSVDRQLRALRQIGASVEIAGRQVAPYPVELSGQLPPLPLQRWVINDVTWGDAIYEELKLVRQHLTITFGAPPEDDAVRVGAGGRSKFRTRSGKKKKKLTAKLLEGETLQQFAARVLGNPGRWREVAALQKPKIKDPRKPGAAGRALKLPKN